MYMTERGLHENGRDYAFRTITDNIIRLELAPGSRISENELASRLGLSRTPVREALQELVKAKLVEVYPQRGSVVSLIDYDLIEEARFVRCVLECAVIELVCDVVTPHQIAELESNVKMQEFWLENFSPEKLMELDNEFHRMLFVIANKHQSYVMMERMSMHFDRVRNMALNAVKDIKIVEDHKEILQAIRDKKPVLARQLMDHHLNRYRVDESAIRQLYPQYMKNR